MFGVNAGTQALGGGDGGGHEIFATAMGRWLNVSELESLLTPETTPLSISTSKPISPPPSGTLILYDRSVTRNYKDDGYEWVKKRNSHKVREDHVKLRVGGRFRVAGCYVHCVTNATLHRRAYHLLDPETGTALNPPNSSANAQLQRRVSSESLGSDATGTSTKNQPSLILVHYLDTQVAALHSAKIAAEAPRSDSSDAGSRRGGRRRSKSPGRSRGTKNNRAKSAAAATATALADAQEAEKQQRQQLEQQQRMQQLLLQKQQVGAAIAQIQAGAPMDPSSATQEQLRMLQDKLKQEEEALAADVASASMPAGNMSVQMPIENHGNRVPAASAVENETGAATTEAGATGKFDDDTLGILWGMVMEEGGDNGFEEIIHGSGGIFDGSDAINNILGETSGKLETLDETAGEEGNMGSEEGMSAVAASAVSAFEQEIYEAAKMTLNKGKSSGQGTEIAAELAAAVEAAVEPQLTQQDIPQQTQPTVPPFQGVPPVATPTDSSSILSVQQQLEVLQRQRMELERQQQLQLKQQQIQQEEEAQKLQQQLRELQENRLKQQREAQRLQQEQLQQRQAEEQIRVERQSQELHQQLQKQLELQNQKWNSVGQGGLVGPLAPASSSSMNQPSMSAFKSEGSDIMDTESEAANDRLLDIVDFTPEHAMIQTDNNMKRGKIVLSCSAPIPTLSDANDPVFSWHTLVAFVDVGSGINSGNIDLQINAVDLSVLRKLNPYSYRCTVPSSAKLPGERLLIIVGVRLYSGTDPVCQGVGAGVAIALQAAWRTACINMANKSPSSRPIFSRRQVSSGPGANANIQLLSQLSEDSFLFQEGADVSTSSTLSSTAFLRPGTKNSVSTASSANGKTDASLSLGISSVPVGNVTAASALDEGASLRQSRKRSAPFSSMDMNAPFSPGYNAMAIINTSTPPWTNSAIKDETMMEDMDRHCKIRFVEKSSDGVPVSKNTPPTAPSPGPILDVQQKDLANESGGFLFLDSTELKGMDNDKVDSVLDSLLIRLVENLVEISCSSKQLQDELNSPDKSGFTLLHYASLYNLQSLIPILISHGANPDALTTRGRFTPLHLACAAGNEAVVDLLVRSGCTVWVYDAFNSSPADHAVRNGFPKISQWLRDTAGEDTSIKEKKESDSMELDQRGDMEMDIERSLAQNAFSNLSLKDKLALNLLLKKRKNAEEQNGSSGDVSTADNDKLVAYLASAISESDKESLNMAMRLMNQEELDDLENKSRGVDEDLRKWMLRRNYESLKEATLYAQHTKNERSNIQQPGDLLSSSRGLHNVKNQAIAGLIIRKNMSRLRNGGEDPLSPS